MRLRSFSYTLQRLLGRTFMTATSATFGLKFRFKAADVVGRFIYKYDIYEPETTHCLLSEIQFNSDDIVLDVGANIGWYSLIAAKYGANVHAFEPDPLNFKLLNENIDINHYSSKIQAHQLAVSDQESILPLYLYPDKNRGRHSLHAIDGCEKIDVKTIRLDDFITEQSLAIDKIRLIKMDIEGHEYPALKGASTLLEHVPYLLIEHAPDHIRRGDYDPKSIIKLLETYHYSPFLVSHQGCQPITIEALLNDETEQNILWKKSASE